LEISLFKPACHTLLMVWKEEVLNGLGFEWVRLGTEEWVLLLLEADDRQPVRGIHSLHVMLLMARQPVFDFKPLLLGVYSPEVQRAVERLIDEGLLKRDYVYEKRRLVEVYSMTPRGEEAARRVVAKVKNSWLLIGDIVLREGSKVLSEIEAVKKTYNGRGVLESLKLILDKMEAAEDMPGLALAEDEVEFVKRLYRSYKMEI